MLGGNVNAEIQVKNITKSSIGENIESWETVKTIRGYLDFISGEKRYTTYDAKIQQSTHVFVCSYFDLTDQILTINTRLVINGKKYDVVLIDNPMELNRQIEILLKYTGD